MTDQTKARYLVLLPGPEAQWATASPEEHEAAMRAHERFRRELHDGGHDIVVASPLRPSAEAVTMRPDGNGGAVTTDGPFAESAEQIVGFYLIATPDPIALQEICVQLASAGDAIELRRLAGADDPQEG